MNFYEFLMEIGSDSIFLVFILGLSICATVFKCVIRICRCINISKSGWPPSHCDVDGNPIIKDK